MPEAQGPAVNPEKLAGKTTGKGESDDAGDSDDDETEREDKRKRELYLIRDSTIDDRNSK